MYKKMKNKNVKKFRKNFNTRLIRSRQNYSREEIAELLHVHQNTVSLWFKEGLSKIDDHQPHLVFGQDLIDFLKVRAGGRKHPCAPDELYCCMCQQPRKSKGNTVCIKVSPARTNIVGFCEICSTKINKTISPHKVDLFKEIFIVREELEENLLECANSCASSDIKTGEQHG